MRVKCINNLDDLLTVTVGKVYDVLSEKEYEYQVQCDYGGSYYYPKKYFEIVEENKMKVKCIDNCRESYPLTIGKEYEASVSSFGDSYIVVGDNGKTGDYFKWRFVPVSNIFCPTENKESTMQSLITELNILHKELEVYVIIHDWGYFIHSWFGEFKVESEQEVLEALNEMLKLVSKYKGENDDNG